MASALANYYQAQADEANSKIGINTAQASLLRMQGAGYADDSSARRAQEYGAANQANAGANLTNVNASLAPADAAARNTSLGANTDAVRAQTGVAMSRLPFELQGLGLQNQATQIGNTFSPLKAQSDLTGAGIQQSLAALGLYKPTDQQLAAGATPAGNDVAPAWAQFLKQNNLPPSTPQPKIGQEKGGVAGRDKAKPGKTDSIPTMLAPGEAVLNAHAVEHYGTDVVDQMNNMGMLRGKAQAELMKAHKALAKNAAKTATSKTA